MSTTILIILIAAFAFVFIRGLRGGSSFIWDRYTGEGAQNRPGPSGYGRTGRNELYESEEGMVPFRRRLINRDSMLTDGS